MTTENESPATPTADVKSTSVSITLNAKSLGVDAFIKLEQTNEFVNLGTEVDALVKREELAALLTEQALAIIADTAKAVKNYATEHQLTSATSVAPLPSTGAASIRGAANSAGNGGEWRTAPDAFDAAKSVRFLSTSTFPSEQLKREAGTWLSTQGFNPENFDIWDERKDAEGGKAISSVCNVKIKEALRGSVPAEITFTERGGVKSIARAKFNSDGSLYFHWTNKAVDAAVKYGALDSLK